MSWQLFVQLVFLIFWAGVCLGMAMFISRESVDQ